MYSYTDSNMILCDVSDKDERKFPYFDRLKWSKTLKKERFILFINVELLSPRARCFSNKVDIF